MRCHFDINDTCHSDLTRVRKAKIDEDITNEIQGALKSEADLRVRGLTKAFRRRIFSAKKLALKKMYLTGKQGEIIALLGHNGAGKTTLINVRIPRKF